jgi:S1-C subfamily serine protease
MTGVRGLFVVLAAALLTACSSSAKPLEGDPFVRAFKTLRPSVVLFTMQIPSDDPKKKGSWDDAYGSGVIVASGRWGSRVLTAEHVIHGARNLRATLRERKAVPVNVLARDEKADLALVGVSTPDLPVARLGTTRGIEPGTAIGVAGFPIPDAFADEGLGVATSVYAGRVSSVRKDALELDLPIIPGESGGPVFDAASGEVIGLAESRFEEEKAIGFAIPIDDALRFMHAAKPNGPRSTAPAE